MWKTRVTKLWQMSKWFVGGGVLSILFYDNIGYVHTVRGKSMAPTLNPGPTRALLRERVWLSKLPYTPHVGDIVVFRSPKHGSKLAMKRIAAVGGETIVPSKVVKSGASAVTIKPGYVWVEADNRDTAGRDSNEYGQLHEKMIVGKVTWLLWPWARIQDLRKTQPPHAVSPQTQSLDESERTELVTESQTSLSKTPSFMAPKVIVPMNFGRHLRESPSHNNLKLNTSDGGEVWASSVILSFNSPVIDHLTTTLHMTSVDMLEFSEAAVQVFVDSAYSGTAEGINKEIFRDVNKIASVFEVAWLVLKCADYFAELTNSVKSGSYTDLLFLFEEAGFVFENLKTKHFLNLAIKKIESLNWKQQFLERYLENAERLSTNKLDTVIELAGNDVNYVVQTLVNQMSEMFKVQAPSLPVSFKYLLDNSELHILCQHLRYKNLFNELFDVLKDLPNYDEMRWTLELHRKSTEKSLWGAGRSLPDSSTTSIAGSSGVGDCQKSTKIVVSQSSFIPNFYHDLALNMGCNEMLKFLSESEHVTSLLMAIDAVWMWSRNITHRPSGGFSISLKHLNTNLMYNKLTEMMKSRQWPRLPPQFMRYEWRVNVKQGWARFDWSQFCLQQSQTSSQYVIINSIESFRKPLDVFSKSSELTFHFKHPSVTRCNLPGKCGFILKTVPSTDKPLWKLRLCTEKEDYHNKTVHFHTQLRAENMHIYFAGLHLSCQPHLYLEYLPLSWLGWIRTEKKRSDWENKFIYIEDLSGFRVLYRSAE